MANSSFALLLQRIRTGRHQVLIVGQLAGARNEYGWFSPSDVRRLFEALKVPAPRDVPTELSRLRSDGYVIRRNDRPGWSLSPEGRERVNALVGRLDPAQIAVELGSIGGAELGHTRHTVLPPTLAPPKWSPAIAQMLSEHDFDSSVFCMTRFPEDAHDEETGEYLDPVAAIIPVAREVLMRHGLRLHLASERQLDDDLFGNIAAHMWACRYGIALFEDRVNRGVNSNMLVEIGSMLIMGRRCALLKDLTIDRMPTDFVGQIYKPVDFGSPEEVGVALHGWAAKDLGLGACSACPGS